MYKTTCKPKPKPNKTMQALSNEGFTLDPLTHLWPDHCHEDFGKKKSVHPSETAGKLTVTPSTLVRALAMSPSLEHGNHGCALKELTSPARCRPTTRCSTPLLLTELCPPSGYGYGCSTGSNQSDRNHTDRGPKPSTINKTTSLLQASGSHLKSRAAISRPSGHPLPAPIAFSAEPQRLTLSLTLACDAGAVWQNAIFQPSHKQ